ncbi:MAG TPA: tol-pal system protein YbgF [Gammaproteobacteria bacterium]|nr:tol-pal system protein YbgF [Gammaproteobacteria bacterium]
MKLHTVLACAALAGTTLLAGCATSVSPNDPINQKVDHLQQQVGQMKKTLSGQGLMSIASNQQQLQQEVADLQGQLQQLQHQIQQAQARQQTVDKSFDQRIAALEQGASAVGVQTGSGKQQQSGQSSKQSGSASSSSSSGGTQSDYEVYNAAFNEVKDSRYAEAVADFKAFIKKYPNSRFVPNAMYWMGASYYVNGEYQKAINNFKQVIDKYPKSAKTSDAYLKMANSQIALKDFKAARQSLQTLIQKYPGTTAADIANQRLKNMATQGN